MSEHRKQRLADFATWVRDHISGDEASEAKIFLDRLFQAFGQKGVLEVGGKPEFRIKKAKEDGGGTSFADLVWKPLVLVEMKRRGEDLQRHYRQAFDYWTRLVPGRPRYVVLCNFDEFWVFDFETQMDVPVDRVRVEELPERYGPLAFLFPTMDKPVFGNDHEAVTRDAADHLATCFNKLVVRKVDRTLAQRFILQTLIALFAEDIGLLPKSLVARLLDECKKPSDAYDLLGGLFVEMNSRGKTAGGRFKGVDYFNGGVFAEPARVELYPDELNQLRSAAKQDWSKVRPEIFGTLFEHSLGQEERHAFGAHFTSPVDIMKIVQPTIVEPWRDLIENATSQARLRELVNRMQHYTVLDPACGSGNFLYIAYRELKRLEARIYERLNELSKKGVPEQARIGFVTASQFYGLDINPFAVELAKVTMMIARKLAIDELHVTEPALPLDNLDASFIAGDALIDELGNPVQWPQTDVIIGNPPFLGAKRLKPERGADYVNRVRKAYPEVPGMADYCVYWIRKAHDHLPDCTTDDPVRGRAGLVGTQNIRNNQSRVGGLDHVVKSGTIIEAVDNQPWSGEANVHVSIVNWVKSRDPALVPDERQLWSSSAAAAERRRSPSHQIRSAQKRYELRVRGVEHLNSALSDDADVSGRLALACNKTPKRCFQGKIPGYAGFLLDREQLIRVGGQSEVVVPYLTGRELLNDFKIQRWAIDFGNRDALEASTFDGPFAHVQRHVLPKVQAAADAAQKSGSDMAASRREHLERWWQFWNRRDELSDALGRLRRYIGCSRVTRRPVMVFLSARICPSDLVQVFAFDDDYSFGVLQSRYHFEWFRKSSRLKVESDMRYSVRDVFDTFPWPQQPSPEAVEAVAAAGCEVRRVRAAAVGRIKGGLRSVYRTLELPGRSPLKDAHMALDAATMAAYGFSEKRDLLSQLLELNQDVSRRIERGEPVNPPGVPQCCRCAEELATEDCMTP